MASGKYTKRQLDELKVWFDFNTSPSKRQVDSISAELGLKSAEVWIWFYRQRSRGKTKAVGSEEKSKARVKFDAEPVRGSQNFQSSRIETFTANQDKDASVGEQHGKAIPGTLSHPHKRREQTASSKCKAQPSSILKQRQREPVGENITKDSARTDGNDVAPGLKPAMFLKTRASQEKYLNTCNSQPTMHESSCKKNVYSLKEQPKARVQLENSQSCVDSSESTKKTQFASKRCSRHKSESSMDGQNRTSALKQTVTASRGSNKLSVAKQECVNNLKSSTSATKLLKKVSDMKDESKTSVKSGHFHLFVDCSESRKETIPRNKQQLHVHVCSKAKDASRTSQKFEKDHESMEKRKESKRTPNSASENKLNGKSTTHKQSFLKDAGSKTKCENSRETRPNVTSVLHAKDIATSEKQDPSSAQCRDVHLQEMEQKKKTASVQQKKKSLSSAKGNLSCSKIARDSSLSSGKVQMSVTDSAVANADGNANVLLQKSPKLQKEKNACSKAKIPSESDSFNSSDYRSRHPSAEKNLKKRSKRQPEEISVESKSKHVCLDCNLVKSKQGQKDVKSNKNRDGCLEDNHLNDCVTNLCDASPKESASVKVLSPQSCSNEANISPNGSEKNDKLNHLRSTPDPSKESGNRGGTEHSNEGFSIPVISGRRESKTAGTDKKEMQGQKIKARSNLREIPHATSPKKKKVNSSGVGDSFTTADTSKGTINQLASESKEEMRCSPGKPSIDRKTNEEKPGACGDGITPVVSKSVAEGRKVTKPVISKEKYWKSFNEDFLFKKSVSVDLIRINISSALQKRKVSLNSSSKNKTKLSSTCKTDCITSATNDKEVRTGIAKESIQLSDYTSAKQGILAANARTDDQQGDVQKLSLKEKEPLGIEDKSLSSISCVKEESKKGSIVDNGGKGDQQDDFEEVCLKERDHSGTADRSVWSSIPCIQEDAKDCSSMVQNVEVTAKSALGRQRSSSTLQKVKGCKYDVNDNECSRSEGAVGAINSPSKNVDLREDIKQMGFVVIDEIICSDDELESSRSSDGRLSAESIQKRLSPTLNNNLNAVDALTSNVENGHERCVSPTKAADINQLDDEELVIIQSGKNVGDTLFEEVVQNKTEKDSLKENRNDKHPGKDENRTCEVFAVKDIEGGKECLEENEQKSLCMDIDQSSTETTCEISLSAEDSKTGCRTQRVDVHASVTEEQEIASLDEPSLQEISRDAENLKLLEHEYDHSTFIPLVVDELTDDDSKKGEFFTQEYDETSNQRHPGLYGKDVVGEDNTSGTDCSTTREEVIVRDIEEKLCTHAIKSPKDVLDNSTLHAEDNIEKPAGKDVSVEANFDLIEHPVASEDSQSVDTVAGKYDFALDQLPGGKNTGERKEDLSKENFLGVVGLRPTSIAFSATVAHSMEAEIVAEVNLTKDTSHGSEEMVKTASSEAPAEVGSCDAVIPGHSNDTTMETPSNLSDDRVLENFLIPSEDAVEVDANSSATRSSIQEITTSLIHKTAGTSDNRGDASVHCLETNTSTSEKNGNDTVASTNSCDGIVSSSDGDYASGDVGTVPSDSYFLKDGHQSSESNEGNLASFENDTGNSSNITSTHPVIKDEPQDIPVPVERSCQSKMVEKLKKKRGLNELVTQLKSSKHISTDEANPEKCAPQTPPLPTTADIHLPYSTVSINRNTKYVPKPADSTSHMPKPAVVGDHPELLKGKVRVNKNFKRPPIPESVLKRIQNENPLPFEHNWKKVGLLIEDVLAKDPTGNSDVAEGHVPDSKMARGPDAQDKVGTSSGTIQSPTVSGTSTSPMGSLQALEALVNEKSANTASAEKEGAHGTGNLQSPPSHEERGVSADSAIPCPLLTGLLKSVPISWCSDGHKRALAGDGETSLRVQRRRAVSGNDKPITEGTRKRRNSRKSKRKAMTTDDIANQIAAKRAAMANGNEEMNDIQNEWLEILKAIESPSPLRMHPQDEVPIRASEPCANGQELLPPSYESSMRTRRASQETPPRQVTSSCDNSMPSILRVYSLRDEPEVDVVSCTPISSPQPVELYKPPTESFNGELSTSATYSGAADVAWGRDVSDASWTSPQAAPVGSWCSGTQEVAADSGTSLLPSPHTVPPPWHCQGTDRQEVGGGLMRATAGPAKEGAPSMQPQPLPAENYPALGQSGHTQVLVSPPAVSYHPASRALVHLNQGCTVSGSAPPNQTAFDISKNHSLSMAHQEKMLCPVLDLPGTNVGSTYVGTAPIAPKPSPALALLITSPVFKSINEEARKNSNSPPLCTLYPTYTSSPGSGRVLTNRVAPQAPSVSSPINARIWNSSISCATPTATPVAPAASAAAAAAAASAAARRQFFGIC